MDYASLPQMTNSPRRWESPVAGPTQPPGPSVTPGGPVNMQAVLSRPNLPIAPGGPSGSSPIQKAFEAYTDSFGNMFPGSSGGTMSIARPTENFAGAYSPEELARYYDRNLRAADKYRNLRAWVY